MLYKKIKKDEKIKIKKNPKKESLASVTTKSAQAY